MVSRSGCDVRPITILPEKRTDFGYGSKEALMFMLLTVMVILSASLVAGKRLRAARMAVIVHNRTRRIL